MRLRYCQRPGGPGNFVAATPNVSCATAKYVSKRMGSRGCIEDTQCTARRFVCVSYYNNDFARPFSYTHHGICVRGSRRRIVFDWG
jgi:hypothetical protein